MSQLPLEITAALGELAVRLGAPDDLPPDQLVAHLHRILAAQDRWLLIFDNATNPAALEPYLPDTGGGHVLITSRNAAWHGFADPIGVDLLPLDNATDLLCTRSGDRDRTTARTLAEELGRLPLALEQAAAYAAELHLPLAAYLALYRQRHTDLLARGQPLAYHGTVAATVTLTVEHLRATNPAGLHLLELCSLLAPDELPIHELLSRPDRLSEPLAAAARDPVTRQETIGALYQAG